MRQKDDSKNLKTMQLLRPIALAFINTFGITQPTPAQERQATWFIATLLFVVVIMVLIAVALFVAHAR